MVFDYERWEQQLPDLKKTYNTENPYPHICMDNFLEKDTADKAMASFPSVKDEGWIHYVHFNERKHGLNKMEVLPPFIQEVITELNSDRFVGWVSELTGIPNLKADEMLEGGGLHQSLRNGFLNIHADFTVHPHKKHWQRRVNILIYLNEDWQEEYNGHLELWTRDMKECKQRILPIFNRCCIFNTDADSYHGVPEKILCPEDSTRKSIALYYFTEHEEVQIKRSTNYQARPGDGWRSALIYLDKQAVAIYTFMKGTLGIDDKIISKVLNIFGKK
jgi:hypothetical protein